MAGVGIETAADVAVDEEFKLLNNPPPPAACPPIPPNKDLGAAGVEDDSGGFEVPNSPPDGCRPDPKDKPGGFDPWLLAGGGPAGVVELLKVNPDLAGVVAPDGIVVLVPNEGMDNPGPAPLPIAGSLFSLPVAVAEAPLSFFWANDGMLNPPPEPNAFEAAGADDVAVLLPNIEGAVPVLFPKMLGVVVPDPGLEAAPPNIGFAPPLFNPPKTFDPPDTVLPEPNNPGLGAPPDVAAGVWPKREEVAGVELDVAPDVEVVPNMLPLPPPRPPKLKVGLLSMIACYGACCGVVKRRLNCQLNPRT